MKLINHVTYAYAVQIKAGETLSGLLTFQHCVLYINTGWQSRFGVSLVDRELAIALYEKLLQGQSGGRLSVGLILVLGVLLCGK